MTNVTVKVTPPNVTAQRIEIACKLITGVYTLFMAWQVAKMVCPPLAVQEQILLMRLEKHLNRNHPARVTQRQADEFVAEVTKWVREQ